MDDKTTEAARYCNEQYFLTLRSVLEEGKWPFATIEEPVERIDVEEYSKEQKYVYRIPANSALVIGLSKRFNRKSMRKGIDWDIRYIPSIKESAIICNVESTTDEEIEKDIYQDDQIMIEYISETQQTSSYTATFVRCLVAQLAADLAMPITHDLQRFSAMQQYATELKAQALRQALNEDGQDRKHWVDPITASRGW